MFAAQVTDVSAGQNPAADYTFSFGVDTLPTVTSTVPMGSATGVKLNATVTINFSEPVNDAPGAFTFTCGGPVAYFQSAGPASSYTLTPSGNLPASTTCTVSVDKTKITDVDGGLNMAANFSFMFTTGTPPTITSANNTTFTVGINGSFQVTATGTPNTFTFSETGALPLNLSFNTGNGQLSGTPAAGTQGTYPITFGASNGITPDASQNFTLKVCPVITVSLSGQGRLQKS